MQSIVHWINYRDNSLLIQNSNLANVEKIPWIIQLAPIRFLNYELTRWDGNRIVIKIDQALEVLVAHTRFQLYFNVWSFTWSALILFWFHYMYVRHLLSWIREGRWWGPRGKDPPRVSSSDIFHRFNLSKELWV